MPKFNEKLGKSVARISAEKKTTRDVTSAKNEGEKKGGKKRGKKRGETSGKAVTGPEESK